MKRLLSLLLLAAFAFSLNAQSKATQKADSKFKKNAYEDAAADYETLAKLAEKSRKTPPFDVAYVYNQLGVCYLFLKEYAKAETVFTKAQTAGCKAPLFLQNYGDALSANGKDQEALEKYRQYQTENPDSASALLRIRKAEYALLSKANPHAKSNPVTSENKLNAINSQYSLAWYKGSLLFSSNRSSVGGSKKQAPTHFFYAQPIFDFQQDRVADWNPLKELKELKTPNPDHSFAYDHHTATYYVMRCIVSAKSKNCNIYAYRANAKGKLDKPKKQSFHDEKASIGHPALSSDGKIMFFTMSKDKRSDLYVVKKQSDDTWSTPIALGSTINTEFDESHPFLYRDSLLFFASDGHPGLGALDIFYTKITIQGEGHAVSGNSDLTKLEYSNPINLEYPINSSADDFSILIKSDGKGGYLISNRTEEGLNRSNIYSFPFEPYVFDEPGKYLVERLPSGTSSAPVAMSTMIKTDTVYKIKNDTVFIQGKELLKTKNDTVFVEVVREVPVGQSEAEQLLQEKNQQISGLQQDLEVLRKQLSVAQQNLAHQPLPEVQSEKSTTLSASPVYKVEPEVSQAYKPAETETSYRVQIGAILSSSTDPNFYEVFRELHQNMPNLRMETRHESDGYCRYVTIPFVTFAEADALRSKIKAQGVQCFVATYKGEQRISINVK